MRVFNIYPPLSMVLGHPTDFFLLGGDNEVTKLIQIRRYTILGIETFVYFL